MNTLEFFDYIFDRYAYLDVDDTLSQEELRREISRRRAENHPDKLLRVSAAIRSAASREMERIDDCARMLLNEALRPLYNEKLAEFKAKSPHLVSTDGIPMLDPSRFRINIDYLLNEEEFNLDRATTLATSMSGHDDKHLAKVQSRFDRNPDDLELRDDLRAALTRKLIFLLGLEECCWQKAGVTGALNNNDHLRATDSEHFTEHLETKLAEIRVQAQEAVSNRQGMASLGFAPLLLLEGPTASNTESANSAVSMAVTKKVLERFEERIADLQSIIEQKRQTIAELIQVPRWRALVEDKGTNLLDILLMSSEADFDDNWPGEDFFSKGWIMRVNKKTGVLTPILGEYNQAELSTWPNELVVLEPNPEIPGLFLEAIALAETLTPG